MSLNKVLNLPLTVFGRGNVLRDEHFLLLKEKRSDGGFYGFLARVLNNGQRLLSRALQSSSSFLFTMKQLAMSLCLSGGPKVFQPARSNGAVYTRVDILVQQ